MDSQSLKTGPRRGIAVVAHAMMIAVMPVFGLTACAGTSDAPLPVQVYAAEIRLDAALAAADAYVRSPGADPGAVQAIKALNEAAHSAVMAADAALAQPDASAVALTASLTALDGLTSRLAAAMPAQKEAAR